MDIDKNERGVQTYEAQLNILQNKTLKTNMNYISMKKLWN